MEVLSVLILVAIIICYKSKKQGDYYSNFILKNYKKEQRRNYYRNDYLKSDAWKRKRYLVLKRDNWTCQYCRSRATQVHHLKYAKNIGKEPIKWLVSICKSCHNSIH